MRTVTAPISFSAFQRKDDKSTKPTDKNPQDIGSQTASFNFSTDRQDR